jgi:hypothetical protein
MYEIKIIEETIKKRPPFIQNDGQGLVEAFAGK